MEAFELGIFKGSIWIGPGETSRCELFYLDRPFIRNMGLIYIVIKIWMKPGGHPNVNSPDQILGKMAQNLLKLCKKWGSKVEASTLVGIQGLHLDRAGGMI